jgi:hypothetical protein
MYCSLTVYPVASIGRLRRLLAVYDSISTDILQRWLISLPKSENPGMASMVFSFAISVSVH